MTYELLKGLFRGRGEKAVEPVQSPETLARREKARALLAKLVKKPVEEVVDALMLQDLFQNVDSRQVLGLLVMNGYGARDSGALYVSDYNRDTVKTLLDQVE